MTENLFDQEQNNTEDFDSIIAKWKDKPQNELLEAKAKSDLYVRELTSKLDEMREDLLQTRAKANEQAKLEDLLARLETSVNRDNVADTQANDNAQQPPFDMNEIESLVSKKIQETEANKRATDNFNIVQSKLKEQFGNNYVNVLKEKSSELGLSMEDVNTLARKSPNAFFNTLGLNQQSFDNYQAPPRSTTKSETFTPAVKKRTWSYWQEMRKTDPSSYYDPKQTLQRIKDAETLGDAFKDGDYKLYGH